MDVSTVTQLISSVGFPIVACGVLAYLFYREQENHKEETDKFGSKIPQRKNRCIFQQVLSS